MNRMGKDFPENGYLDFPDGTINMGARSIGKELEEEQQIFPVDYDALLNEANYHPSLRDSEYLQQSSLWGNQFMSGGAGEGIQRLKPEGSLKNKQEIKTDATLPAYCNPPNPCPLGYTGRSIELPFFLICVIDAKLRYNEKVNWKIPGQILFAYIITLRKLRWKFNFKCKIYAGVYLSARILPELVK